MLSAFAGCTTILGDFEIGGAGLDDGGSGDGGRNNGEGCQSGTECASGFCTDGVCCESACSGTCESCALAEKGKCTPVPDGTDPDKECLPTPRPDAGTVVIDDAGVDASADDGGATVNVPDGGLLSDDSKCGGSCNGARQCKFPGTETTCGSKFCNTLSEGARFSCDGKGRCELGFTACSAFACENDACRTTCAAQDDCNTATHFCNPQGVCQEKLGNGVACTLPNDCQSGFCVGAQGAKVCCNADCDQIVGGDCARSGTVGQCKCSRNCGSGSCRLYYRDADGDGFGDKFATYANGKAVLGCDNENPESGYVATNDDCADNDPRAKPGQTAYYATPITGTASYDFNCNGVVDKETDEFVGATCTYCDKGARGCYETNKCATVGQASFLSCAPGKPLCLPGFECGTVCGGSPLNPYRDGFTTTVACGTTGTYTTCGSCEKGGAITGTTTASKQQRCR